MVSFHSFMSFLTGFEPSLSVPSIEKYFEFYSAEDRTDLDARDGDWSPYPMQRPEQRALLAKTLSALCALCQIFHQISAWNNTHLEDNPLGSRPDLSFRIQMFQELSSWNAQLHLNLRPGSRTMAHNYYLRSVMTLWLLETNFPSTPASRMLIPHAVVVVSTTLPTLLFSVPCRDSRTFSFQPTSALHEIYASNTPQKAWRRSGCIDEHFHSNTVPVLD